MQGHATSCKVIQHYTRSCNVMQSHARSRHTTSCKVSHTPAWLALLSCRNVSPVFRLFQAVRERWLSTTGGLWNLSWSLLCCFFRIQSLFAEHFKKSNFLQFHSIKERDGAWSTDSDWGHLVLTIGLSQSSGSLFVSNNLCLPCRSFSITMTMFNIQSMPC